MPKFPDLSEKATPQRIDRKTVSGPAIWPCKINGCNKQFAREADLKRHQRTTKLHSMPGFSCPQCDAAFTRPDALRRHQKSRHNGVVIELPERDTKGDLNDDGASGSQSDSRSGSPSSKGKGREAHSLPPPQPPPRGPSSYYRPHTITTTPSPYIQRPPAPFLYPPPGLSPPDPQITMASAWNYPPPWQNGMQPLGFPQLYYSPYYRDNATIPQPPAPPLIGSNQSPEEPPISPAFTNTNPSQEIMHSTNSSGTTSEGTAPPTPSLIDETLITTETTAELTEEQVLELTRAAVKAVLEAEAERSQARNQATVTTNTSYTDLGDLGGPLGTLDLNGLPEYTLGGPDEMEHILAEHGEPILNPAELLTQDSLASPPPL